MAVLSGCKMSRSSHPPARILSVYSEDITGLSQSRSCPEGLSHTFPLMADYLKMAATVGTRAESTFQRRTGLGASRCPRASRQVNQRSHPLHDLLQLDGGRACVLSRFSRV